MNLRAFVSILIIPAAFLSAPAIAQDTEPSTSMDAHTSAEQTALEMRASQVVELLNGELETPFEDVFTAEFLAAIPSAQLTALSQQFTAQYGRAVAVERLEPPTGNQAALEIRMENAIGKGGIVIDPADENRISGLRFVSFNPIDDSFEKVVADLSALPGTVSAYFGPVDGVEPVIELNPDTQLAIGSTAKLYVLGALGADLVDEQRTLEDVTTLDSISFPSGILQNWPDGSPLTLHTLASLMISISDNTATDQLIGTLRRVRVEEFVASTGHSNPQKNTPFLSTRELFIIKGEGIADLYLPLPEEEKRNWLTEITGSSISGEAINQALSGKPVDIDTIEWFASASDLRRLAKTIIDQNDREILEILSINPSVSGATAEKWSYIGYKGGSEPGVLNFTWLLKDEQSQWHVLTLGWNNPEEPLDNTALELIAQRIFSLPR